MQVQLIFVSVIALVGILGLVWTNNKRRREFLKLVNAWVACDVIHSTLSSEKAPKQYATGCSQVW